MTAASPLNSHESMLEKLRQFFAIDLPEIKTNLALLVARKKEEASDVKLMRHLLGSMDLSDVKPIEGLTDGTRRDFAASIAIVFPKIERIIKPLIDEQKDAGYTLEGDTKFIKGTMNGIYLVLEAFETLRDEHLENTKPKEDFDPHASLPELLERFSRPSGAVITDEKVD